MSNINIIDRLAHAIYLGISLVFAFIACCSVICPVKCAYKLIFGFRPSTPFKSKSTRLASYGLKLKEWYRASSSLHERFQTWNEGGLWKKIYRVLVNYYHKKRRIQWKWQAVGSKMVPAPLGGMPPFRKLYSR
jgi:hypothetical protein